MIFPGRGGRYFSELGGCEVAEWIVAEWDGADEAGRWLMRADGVVIPLI